MGDQEGGVGSVRRFVVERTLCVVKPTFEWFKCIIFRFCVVSSFAFRMWGICQIRVCGVENCVKYNDLRMWFSCRTVMCQRDICRIAITTKCSTKYCTVFSKLFCILYLFDTKRQHKRRIKSRRILPSSQSISWRSTFVICNPQYHTSCKTPHGYRGDASISPHYPQMTRGEQWVVKITDHNNSFSNPSQIFFTNRYNNLGLSHAYNLILFFKCQTQLFPATQFVSTPFSNRLILTIYIWTFWFQNFEHATMPYI